MMEEEADDIVFDSAQLIKKRGVDSKRTRDRICRRPEQLRRGRVARTCFIFASFVCLGLSAAVTGPTLPYFMQKFQLDVGKLSYIYTACCFGYMIGSVVGSIVFEQFGRDHLLLGGGMAAGALGLALAPFASSLLMLCCVLAITGLANGFLYSGGVALCCRQWGSRSSSIMEWLYFAVSVGALVAPLLCAAFIAAPASTSPSVRPQGAVFDALPEAGRPIALPKRDVHATVSSDSSMNSTDFSSSLLNVPLPTSSDSLLTTAAALMTSLVSDPVIVNGVHTTVESSSLSNSAISTAASLIPSTTAKLKKPNLANGNILSQNTDYAAGHALGHLVSDDRNHDKPNNFPSAPRGPLAPASSSDISSVGAKETVLSTAAASAAVAGITDMPLTLSSTSNFTSRPAVLETDADSRSTSLVVRDENATDTNNSFSSGSWLSDLADYRTNESTASVVGSSQISSTLPSFAVTASGAAALPHPIATNDTIGTSAVLSSTVDTDEASTQLATRSVVTSASFAATDTNVSVSMPPSAPVQTDQEPKEPVSDLDNSKNLTITVVPSAVNMSSPAVETTSAVSSTLSFTITAPLIARNSSSSSSSTNAIATAAATASADQGHLATNDTDSQGNVTLTTYGAISLASGQPTRSELRTANPNSTTATTTSSIIAPVSPEPSVAVGGGGSTAGSSQSATATDAEPHNAPIDRHTHSAYIDDIQFVYLVASAALLLVAVGFMCLSVDDRDAVIQPPTALSVQGSLANGDDGRSSSVLALHASLTPSSRVATENGGVKFASRILALAFVVCVLYMGVEVASGQLLATYAMRSAAVPGEHHAALLVAAFWGAFALVRGLSAIAVASSSRQLCRCLSPAALLTYGLAISCIALIVLSFSGGNGGRPTAAVTWAGSALLGGGLAPVFPACLAWTQQYMDLGAARIRAALVGGSSLGGMVLPVVAGYILELYPPSYAFYALLGTVAACAAAFALAWYTAAAAHGSRLACCVDGRASYEAVATDALPIDDGFGYPHERTPAAERLHPKRNTGHKTVSFRLLDDDSDKDV